MSQHASTNRTRKGRRSTLPPSLPNQLLVNTLLESKPHIYVKDRDHTASKGTRPPKFYDLHLHESLRLKNIVLSEDLLPALSTLCDQYMTLNQKRRHSDSNKLQVLLQNALDANICPPIKNEQCITDDFLRRTGKPCNLVASTLLFELDDWDSVLGWESTSMRNTHGLADGYLVIPKVIIPTLTEEQQADLEAIKSHLLDNLAVWEFKSLQAADLKVMEGIVRLTEREFTWMTCGSIHGSAGLRLTCGNSSDSPFSDKHSTNNIWSVTGRKTGPDARQLWWSTNDGSSHPGVIQIGEKRKNPDFEYLALSDSGTMSSSTTPSSLPQHSSATTEIIAKSVKPSSEDDQYSLDEDSEPTDTDDEDFGVPHHVRNFAADSSDLLKPGFITQQVWASLVHEDATFIVINAGNYEIIGRRHRESRTLYLSPVIHVSTQSNPSHYKIHIGLGIAAYHDTRDRVRQLKQMLLKPQDEWLPTYRTYYDYDSLKYPNSTKEEDSNYESEAVNTERAESARVLRKKQSIRLDILNEELIKQLRTASHLAMVLPRYILSGDVLHSFRRKVLPSSHSIEFVIEGKSEAQIDGKFDTDIQFQIGNLEPLSGAAYSASLTRIDGPIKTVYSHDLVLKFARNKSRKERLEKEYSMYDQLSKEKLPCLVPTYGLFMHEDPEIGFEVLLMGHGGVPLSKLVSDKKFEILKRHYWDTIKHSLSSSIHGSNFLHNGLDLEHILFNKKKDRIVFISLADLEKIHGEEHDEHGVARQQDRDMNALRFVLHDALT